MTPCKAIDILDRCEVEDFPWLRIAIEGMSCPSWLPGTHIEAAFRVPWGGFLLLATNFFPKRTLNILLLATDRVLLDMRMLSQSLTAEKLRAIEVAGPHRISFSYFKHDQWIVEVPRRPVKRRPFILHWLLRSGLRLRHHRARSS